MTAAPGGTGKSSLVLAEAVAMATGKDLLGVGYTPERKLRVWVWNGEDPIDEAQRRIAAICLHYGVKREHIEGQLFLDSGRSKSWLRRGRAGDVWESTKAYQSRLLLEFLATFALTPEQTDMNMLLSNDM
jgi:AAA domain